ncbi:hypothetical protein JG688_00016339, partial [Phytophthora aleatoria]
SRSEIDLRQVWEEEATSVIGTFVGSCVCIARASSGRGPSWNYGAVSGYSWDPTTRSGVLHIAFDAGVEPVPFRATEVRHISYAEYALRSCADCLVCDLMPAEMHTLHETALNHFQGIGCRASHRSKTILEKLHAPVVDEEQAVPLYDMSS